MNVEIHTKDHTAEDTKATPDKKSGQLRHKRASIRPPTLKNDIYISRKSSFPALERRAKKLMKDPTVAEIHIHGMGAAMNRAVELALELRRSCPDAFETRVDTSTVDLIDDVIEQDEKESSLKVETRSNSAIHIHLTKKLGQGLFLV